MKINCIIVEDEPLAQERVRAFVHKVPYLELKGVFDNPFEVLEFMKVNSVDLMFLDIQMDGLTGIELMESWNLDIDVILTTAYDQYALKGYELNVVDYLLKPFTFPRFLQAVEKAAARILPEQEAPEKEYLFVKSGTKLEKIMLADILYIEGMRDYRRIHTPVRRIMTLQTFAEFETEIPSRHLCRVHKSYMVAPHKIDSIERNRIRIGEAVIPISETYKSYFFALIGE